MVAVEDPLVAADGQDRQRQGVEHGLGGRVAPALRLLWNALVAHAASRIVVPRPGEGPGQQRQRGVGIGGGEKRRALRRVQGPAGLGVGGEVFARVAHAHGAAVEGQEPGIMLGRQGGLLGPRRRRGRPAGERRRDLSDQPGTARGGPADHHPRGPRFRQAGAGAGEVGHVAVGDHRDRYRLRHRPDRGPVGGAGVELLPGPSVDRDGIEPQALGAGGEVGGVATRIVPAETHLDRHRHRDRPAHGGEQAGRVVEVAHQGRARGDPGHDLGRAAHVHVDHVGAPGLREPRGLGHRPRLAAGELDHVQIDPGARRAQDRLAGAAGEFACRHHLGDHGIGPAAAGDPAHVQVGDAGQGGEQAERSALPRTVHGPSPAQRAQIMISCHSAQQ